MRHFFYILSAIFSFIGAQAQSRFDFAQNSVLAEGRWVKIALDGKDDGLYGISYKQLSNLGFKNPDNVGVYGFGGHVLSEDFSSAEYSDDLQEIATYHDATEQRILFYGKGLISWSFDENKKQYIHKQNTYATRACYFLHEKNSSAIQASLEELIPAEGDTIDAHLLHEQDLINLGKTGREMYGESFQYNQTQTFSFKEKLLPDSIFVTVNFEALASSETSFSVKVNNGETKTAKIGASSGSYTYGVESTLSSSFFLNHDGASDDGISPSVTISFSGNSNVKNAHLNYIRISGKQYPRDKNIGTVSIVGEIANQNLHAIDSVDFVIITAPGLKYYAQQIAEFRATHDGMKVVVVTPEEIYNEYSSGTPDATAIRLFMKHVFGKQNKEGYLLFFGDGHYDNRKVADNPNYLICYETEASLIETSSTVHDDYFGFLENNELRVGIGRIPVHTAKDAEAAVKKIVEYSSNYHYGTWKNKLCFLSDDDKVGDTGSDSPNLHMRHNEQIIGEIQDKQGHKEFIYQKIYLPAYTQTTTASGTDYPDASKEFIETLQQGALVVNYAGHGATYSITHEMLMTTAKASQLNMQNLPLWITASCDISRWDDDEASLGETLLLNDNGGAIALISTTRVVYAAQNLSLNLAIAKSLFKRHADGSRYRLGDILREAKQSLGSDYNKLNFCLLGDPTMILAYPEYQMEVTDVKYSDKVSISGRIINPGTKETATDFNGLVYPTVYDAADSISADKGLWQEPLFKFASRNKKVFSGSDVIKDGLFQFSFITPKDVSGNTTDGLINLYACNESNQEGNGYFENLKIEKPSSESSKDSIGPEIQVLFINTPDFKNLDIVGSTPFFFAKVHDESGFNTTGNSIGHDITLTIRCTSNTLLATKQYILNNYLTTYTGDPTSGDIQFSIPELLDGTYEATFKIWDSMNNSSTKAMTFIVKHDITPETVLVQAYPTPISQGDDVTFRVLHKLPKSKTQLRLQIFTETGIKVAEKTSSTNSSEVTYFNDQLYGASTIKWNASVLPGIYIYKVYLSSEGSEETSESKILMVK